MYLADHLYHCCNDNSTVCVFIFEEKLYVYSIKEDKWKLIKDCKVPF